MSFCTKCGHELAADAAFCGSCGFPVSPAKTEQPPVPIVPASAPADRVRCDRCGTVIEGGSATCPVCGDQALTKDEFAAKVARYQPARLIRRRFNIIRTAFIVAYLLILVAAILTVITNHFGFSMEAVGSLFIIAIILVALFNLTRLTSMGGRLRKAGLTPEQYAQLQRELRALPKSFFKPIPLPRAPRIAPTIGVTPSSAAVGVPVAGASGSPPAGTTIAQTLRQMPRARVIAVAGLVLALAIGGFAASRLLGGQRFAGRWEGQASSSSTSIGGVSMTTTLTPAIVFRGDRAYFGEVHASDSEIISDAWGMRSNADQNGVKYTLTSTTITFVSAQGTRTYKRAGTTIYMGEFVLRPSSGH